MNRIRSLAIATMFLFALSAIAQQAADAPADSTKNIPANGVPSAESQMKLFSEKLELTSDQQDKLKPILDELHDATVKLVQDETMSHDERMEQVRAWRYKTDRRIREILTDEQKKKLDQLYQEPHPELHGNVNASLLLPPHTFV